jgi:hypothetical protein
MSTVRMIRMLHLVALASAIMLVTASEAAATDYKWRNPVSGKWGTADNWVPAGVPGAQTGDTVTIDASSGASYTVTLDAALAQPLAGLTVGSTDPSKGIQTLDLSSKPLALNGAMSILRSGLISSSPPGTRGGLVNLASKTTVEITGDVAVDIGSTPDQYKHLSVSIPFKLTGRVLTVNLANDFAPSAGQRFEIITAPSFSGDFSSKELPPAVNGVTLVPADPPIQLSKIYNNGSTQAYVLVAKK